MPVTLKTNKIKLKDQNGNYQAPVVLADETTAQHVATVNAAITETGQTELAAITAKGEETLASIPSDYTALSNQVQQIQDEVDEGIENLQTAVRNTERIDVASLTWENGALQSNGNIMNNTDWRVCRISVRNSSFLDIDGTFRGLNASSYLHVAFYTSKTANTNYFISGINLHESGDKTYNLKRISVPEDTQLIVLCNIAENINTVSADTSNDGYIYKKVIDSYTTNTIIKADGSIGALNGWSTSNIIDITGNTKILFDNNLPSVNAQYLTICFYDDYGNPIDGSITGKSAYDIPAGAKYVVYSNNNNNTGHYVLNENSGEYNDNFLPFDNLMLNYSDFEIEKNGVTFTKIGDKISIDGAVSAGYNNAIVFCFPLSCIRKGRKYLFTFTQQTGVYFQYYDSSTPWTTMSAQTAITMPNDVTDARIRLLVNAGTTFDTETTVALYTVNEDIDDLKDKVAGLLTDTDNLKLAAQNTDRTEAKVLTWENGVLEKNGNIASNNDWRVTKIPVKDCKFIDITGTFSGLNDNSYSHIAFYKTKTATTTALISRAVFHQSGLKAYDMMRLSVPEETQLIIVCNIATQVSTVSININKSELIFTKITDKLTQGYALNSAGQVTATSGWYVSDAIDISGNTQILFDVDLPSVTSSYCNIAFYDDYENMISGDTAEKAIFNVPAGAAYMRYCTTNSTSDHYVLNKKAGEQNSNFLKMNNLELNYSDFDYTVNGVEFKKTGNNITITGAVAEGYYNAVVYCFPIACIRPGFKYKFAFDSATGIYFQYHDDATSWTTMSTGDEFTLPNNVTYANIRILVNPGTTFNASVNIELTKEDASEIEEITVSTAAQLYNFLCGFPQTTKYVKLYIEPGTYDLYTGLFEEYIEDDSMLFNMNDHYLHNVEIIGNNAVLQLKVPVAANTGHSASVNTVSILNVRGNVFIHDLTLDAENCRYACHDESQGDEDVWNTEHRYKNVVFKYNRSSSEATTGVMQAIGIGGNKGQRFIFENCQFIRSGVGGFQGGAFYIHGRGYNIAELNFTNCIFTSTADKLIHLSQYTGNDKLTAVNISNCLMDGVLKVAPQTDSGFTKQQWVLRIFNSYYTKLLVEESETYPLIEDPTIVNSIDGTISHDYDTE